VALVAALFAWAGCGRKQPAAAGGGSEPAAGEQVRLHLDWHPQTEYGGYYQALERGIYRSAGLHVEIIGGGPAVPFKEMVALGRAEMGSTDGNDVIVAISRGVPLVIVAAEMQRNPQGILFHQEHPVADLRALAGRSFMAGPGNAWVDYLRRGLGIRFDLVPLTADLTSFLGDTRMVRQCFVTQEPYFARQRGAKVGTLLLADSGYEPYRVIYTSRQYLADQPERVRAFVAASVRGFEELVEGDPAPALDALQRANPMMTPDVMACSLQTLREMRLIQGDATRGERVGQIRRERLEQQIEILRSLGQLGRDVGVEDVAAFGFAPP